MRTKDHSSHLIRSTIQLFIVVGASCMLVQSANATLLFSEAFDYTSGTGLPGSVNPGNSTAWSTGNSALLAIGSGNLTYAGLADLGGNMLVVSNGSASSSVNTFVNQTSGTVFYSFLFNPTAADSANNYITAMNPTTGAPNGGSDAIDMYYYTDGHLRLRASPGSATAGTSATLTLNTTYLIVLGLDFNAATASMWINPTPGAAMPTADATISSIGATAVADVGFKSQSAAGGPYLIDNLRIGTTWEDVTPAAVPEPSTLVLAAAGFGFMLTMIRRRRS